LPTIELLERPNARPIAAVENSSLPSAVFASHIFSSRLISPSDHAEPIMG